MMGTTRETYEKQCAAQAQTASRAMEESQPREIQMLTKRLEELTSYGRSSVNRADSALDRLLGSEPQPDCGDDACANQLKAPEGELRAINSVFSKLERVIAEFDHVSRRLETI